MYQSSCERSISQATGCLDHVGCGPRSNHRNELILDSSPAWCYLGHECSALQQLGLDGLSWDDRYKDEFLDGMHGILMVV